MKYTTALVYSLLGIVLCSSCGSSEPTKTEEGKEQKAEQTQKDVKPIPMQAGIWHTGTPTKIITSQHNYTFYTVTHDGSCGFYSMIPIMLDYLLKEDRYSQWLHAAKKEFFDKAAGILQKDALVQGRYTQLAPEQDRDSLYKETSELLNKLKNEEPRKLQQKEIKTLDYFLRHLVLCGEVIKEDKASEPPFHPHLNAFFHIPKSVIYRIESREKELQCLNTPKNRQAELKRLENQKNLIKELNKNIENKKKSIKRENSPAKNKEAFESLLGDINSGTSSIFQEYYPNYFKECKPIIDGSFKEDIILPLWDIGYKYGYRKSWWTHDYALSSLGIPLRLLFELSGEVASYYTVEEPWPRADASHVSRVFLTHRPAFFNYAVRNEP